MRLLHTLTGIFRWEEDPETVEYAILSHVWAKDGEESYQDLLRLQDETRLERAYSTEPLPDDIILKRVSNKIRCACERARADGINFIWADSCCIDKTSSAELSEAINSMYTWYSRASVCYVALPDVDVEGDPSIRRSQFRQSVWFLRGWTLQELIAPESILFFSRDWQLIGGKHNLASIIEEITGIDKEILTLKKPLSSVSVARRMFWASKRVTTRKEDEAYSLMGIFSIRMPTIYGEGREAFIRLQEEILKTIPDQSIFVWDQAPNARRPRAKDIHAYGRDLRALLASSPANFSYSGQVETLTKAQFSKTLRARDFGIPIPPPIFSITPYGIRATLPHLVDELFDKAVKVVPLACSEKNRLLALVLTSPEAEEEDVHIVGGGPISTRKGKEHDADTRYPAWPTARIISPFPGFPRLVYLSFPLRLSGTHHENHHKYVLTELFIAHRTSLIPFNPGTSPGEPPTGADIYRPEGEPPFRYGTFWYRPKEPYPMCIGGEHFAMSLSSHCALAIAQFGYPSFLTSDHVFAVSGSEYFVIIAFYRRKYYKLQYEGVSSLHARYTVIPTFKGRSDSIDAALPDGIVAPRAVELRNASVTVSRDSGLDGLFEPLTNPFSGEHTAVDDWDRRGEHAGQMTRTRSFPLPSPPMKAIGEPSTVESGNRALRLTVTCHCPGSPRYPALFLLEADILDLPSPSKKRSREDGDGPPGLRVTLHDYGDDPDDRFLVSPLVYN